jgi:uncharacterized membrane protein (UPF0136 family)
MFTRNKEIYKYMPLLVIILVFTLFKMAHLTLPHYWDESWSYATAVQKMYESGPTLLPGVVDVDATRGHPLLFYAAAATWMKLLGTSLFVKHTFALSISLTLLSSIYILCNKIFNLRVAIASTLLFGSQIFFFVQSSMLLPEVLVALLFFTSIYFFVTEKYVLSSLSLSLLLFTKESGLVLGLVLGIVLIISLLSKQLSSKLRITKMFVTLLIPALLIITFFIIQKCVYGWYFFPEHIGLIDTDGEKISARFQSMLLIIFTEEKRKWIWRILALLALYYAFIKKAYIWLFLGLPIIIVDAINYNTFNIFNKLLLTIIIIAYILFFSVKYLARTNENQKKYNFLAIAGLFSIAYLFFCTINFFTIRYLLPILLLSIIAFSYWLDVLIQQINIKLYFIFSALVATITIQSYNKNNNIGDTGLGSYNAIEVQKNAINFLVEHKTQNSFISNGSYQLIINLKNSACGFLKSKDYVFKNVNWDIDSTTKYVIFDNIEPDNRYETIKQDKDYELIFRTEKNNVWAEIYKNNAAF